MASYGALVLKITTAEINRVQREGNYNRWAYFVDEESGKVGMVFANDAMFAAYTVDDEPDPRLSLFGQEPIKDLKLIEDTDTLIVTTGENTLQARIFISPAVLLEDDFVGDPDYALTHDWQLFLQRNGARASEDLPSGRFTYVVLGLLALAAMFFILVAIRS